MRILITGAQGFVGRNLAEALKNIRDGKDRTREGLKIEEVFEYDIDGTEEELDRYCREADFVFNLAGVNRPKTEEEFMKGNFGFASQLLDCLRKHHNTCPVMLSSSIQATLEGRYAGSEYGKSKKAGEELFFNYAKETGAKVLVYRFPNLFGKWCRPNYNSAVATFCNNIANDLPIQVNDRNTQLELLYIDDLVEEMLNALQGKATPCSERWHQQADAVRGGEADEVRSERWQNQDFAVRGGTASRAVDTGSGSSEQTPAPSASASEPNSQFSILNSQFFYVAKPTYKITLGEIVDLLHSFAAQPKTLMIPEIPDGSFAKKLYSTYLSYLPKEKVAFPLKMNCDDRGSFTELLKTANCGQVSVNISKPGITKGQHWHNTKWEFFIVVAGEALIQERKVGSDEILEFRVSGKNIQAVHMLPGYTHNIINLSDTEDLVTVMWANESFDPSHPDTYQLRIEN